jgi:hypothetical protein
MANRKSNKTTHKAAIIDTAPGAGGYWTDPISAAEKKVPALMLAISGIFSGTVTLQFKDVFGTWTNYPDTFTDTTKQIIEDATETQWRAGVASGGYTSGAVRVALNYYDGKSA